MADGLNLQAEREAFEKAWRDHFRMPAGAMFSKFEDGNYQSPAINDFFVGWCMARRATPPAPSTAPSDELPPRMSWLGAPHDIPNQHATYWAKGWNACLAALANKKGT